MLIGNAASFIIGLIAHISMLAKCARSRNPVSVGCDWCGGILSSLVLTVSHKLQVTFCFRVGELDALLANRKGTC